jgi:hypothetical protein
MYRLKNMKYKKKKADEFRIGFEKAITEFKAEKRKTFEVKAGAAVQEVIIKHIFRNKLAKAIKARQTVIDYAYSTAYLNKMRKHLISHMLSRRIVAAAFKNAR